jgi:RNA polymerase sigma-70 factor (ECF subfamily)
MTERDWLTEQFENNRSHLRAVAYRMLGSLAEADDAVQECWLRLSRSNTDTVDNFGGWLTTVMSRICLDMLRSRKSRREDPLEPAVPKPEPTPRTATDPEAEAILADSVGYATLVVLDRLAPAERIAFVLHDLFDIPFDEIARITARTPEAARQLASRARRRVRGVTAVPRTELEQQRSIIEEFLAALRLGDPSKLMDLLDPSFSVHADATSAPRGIPEGIHGAEAWARLAVQEAHGARLARVAMVDGSVGIIVAPRGRLFRVLEFTFADGLITGMEIIGDPERLGSVEIGTLNA